MPSEYDREKERERKAEYRARLREQEEIDRELDEQRLREQFGYSDSERRTKLERDTAAGRIIARFDREVEVPADIEAVWGGRRLDGAGQPAIKTARSLIEEWGLARFRRSALHRAALDVRESTPDPR